MAGMADHLGGEQVEDHITVDHMEEVQGTIGTEAGTDLALTGHHIPTVRRRDAELMSQALTGTQATDRTTAGGGIPAASGPMAATQTLDTGLEDVVEVVDP